MSPALHLEHQTVFEHSSQPSAHPSAAETHERSLTTYLEPSKHQVQLKGWPGYFGRVGGEAHIRLRICSLLWLLHSCTRIMGTWAHIVALMCAEEGEEAQIRLRNVFSAMDISFTSNYSMRTHHILAILLSSQGSPSTLHRPAQHCHKSVVRR